MRLVRLPASGFGFSLDSPSPNPISIPTFSLLHPSEEGRLRIWRHLEAERQFSAVKGCGAETPDH